MKTSGPEIGQKGHSSLAKAGDTQVVDLRDVDLSVLTPEPPRRTAPPPLPPEIVANPANGADRISEQPAPSLAPAAPSAESGRSPRFYALVLVGCLVTCAIAGLAIAMTLRAPAPKPALDSAGTPRVITISPVEVVDDGKK